MDLQLANPGMFQAQSPQAPKPPVPVPGGGIGQPPPAPSSTAPLPLAKAPANPGLMAPSGFSGGNRMAPTSMSPATPQAAPPPQAATAPAAAAPIPLATSPGANPYATATTNVPGSNTDYLTKTIAPGPGTDRLALAKSNFQNFSDSTEPEFQASLRDASQQAAGAGQIGSGMARGRLGDIGLARTRDLESAKTGFLNNATEGAIGDAYNNLGIAQQQQQFQAGQQQNAFNQGISQQQLEEMLKSGAFGRAATTTALGEQGNPSDVGLALSGYYGNQAGQAGAGAADLFKNSYLSNALSK